MTTPVVSPPAGDNDARAQAGHGPCPGLTKKFYEARCLLDGLVEPTAEQAVCLESALDQEMDPHQRELVNELASILQRTGSDNPLIHSLNRDGRFELREDNDGWILLLDLEPPVAGGAFVTSREILLALRDRGITQGVDLKAIRQAEATHRSGQVVQDLPIVVGQLPELGRPGHIEIICRDQCDGPPKIYAGLDQAPAKAAERICLAGDIIARLIPSRQGRDGYNARGEAIKAQPVPEPQVYAGVNVAADGDCLVAQVDGTIEITGNTVGVRRQLIIGRDLIGAEAKVYFDGDVRIEGAVRDQARVTATGDITVCDTVGAGFIESTHGSVYLKQGVAGQDQAQIIAERDIHARFAERATLRAGGDILLEVGSIHAKMTAGGSFEAVHNRGQVLGGVVIAGKRITAKQLGNANGVRTLLLAGYSPEDLERWAEIELNSIDIQNRFNKLKELADQIKRMVGNTANLSLEQQATYAQLLQAMILARRELDALESEKIKLNKAADGGPAGEIRALSMLHPGCEIRLGTASHRVNTPRRTCSAVGHNEEVHFRQL